MFAPTKAPPSKLKLLFIILKANLFGIPTPYGFNLKPRAFQTMAQMSQELESMRTKYDYAMSINVKQDAQVKQLYGLASEIRKDAAKMSNALKELSNTPNVLSKETLAILEGYKV